MQTKTAVELALRTTAQASPCAGWRPAGFCRSCPPRRRLVRVMVWILGSLLWITPGQSNPFVLTGVNIRPVITPPGDQVCSEAPCTVQLRARVQDDGLPLPADVDHPQPNDPHKLRWRWSVVSVPSGSAGVVWSGQPTNGEAFTYAGSSNAPGTVFTCDPTAAFDAPGLYRLEFSASDGATTAGSQVRVLVRSAGNYRPLGYRYLSPVPEAEYVSLQTRYILVRFTDVSPGDLTNLATFITVTGAYTGTHPGQTRIASDGETVIFTNSRDFIWNDLVTVRLDPRVAPGSAGTVAPYQYRFLAGGRLLASVPGFAAAPSDGSGAGPSEEVTSKGGAPAPSAFAPQSVASLSPPWASPGRSGIMPNGVSVPANFPHVRITINDNPDPGYIFLDNRTSGANAWNVIFDNTGSPVWYAQPGEERRDMKVQPNGVLTMLARSGGMRFVGLDTNYQEMVTYRAVNGYETDEHELVVLPDGRYLLIGLRWNVVDMSQYVPGGSASANVGETVVQEFTPEGDLIFQWRAWDHYDIRDLQVDSPTATTMRFPHMNSIGIDEDGCLLLSCRHLSEVTKINRDTGLILWRLGGAHSDFAFANDPLNGFNSKHAVRPTRGGRYLMFDNGNLHNPAMSRGVEYELDLTNKTARVVWQYPGTPTPNLYSWYMANTQRLPNSNTLINWAISSLPKLTEVRPDGTKAFEMNWVNNYEAYRVWRCRWHGVALKPNLLIDALPDKVVLLFNKFGDTNVAYYRIYGGTAPNPTSVLATSTVTLANLRNLQNQRQYYFRVTAVDHTGIESPSSEQKSVYVNLVQPGQNMLLNGDFAQGQASWTLGLQGSGSGSWYVSGGAAYIDIANPGTSPWDVQLRQTGMKLVQGSQYVLAFDGWSTAPRVMEARVAQEQSPYAAYVVVTPYLTPVHQRFTYAFEMSNVTDLNARLVLNVGGSTSDVFIDNVVLFNVAPGDLNRDQSVNFQDLSAFTGQWLRQAGGLAADLNGDGRVDFRDFAILGGNWSGGN